MSDGENLRARSIASGKYGRERDYWLEKLSGELTRGCFPYDHHRKEAAGAAEPAERRFSFSPSLAERLTVLSGGSDYTLLMVLVAAVTALLARYTGNNDIITGMPIYKQEDGDNLINTVLVLRNEVAGHMSFKELLMQVRGTIIDAEEHQNYALETLLYQLDIPEVGDDFPLFDVAVMLEGIQDKTYIRHLPLGVVFVFERVGEALSGRLEYDVSRYDEETAARLVRHFTTLLENLAFDVEMEVLAAEILSPEEKEQLSAVCNGEALPFPADKTVHEWFEEQAERTGDRTAVVGEAPVTYAELNEQSDRVASILFEKGVGPDDIVAIMAERSVETVVGILGILKAGGAYLPIDPDYPEERIRYMLEDSGAVLLSEKLCGGGRRPHPLKGRRPRPFGRAAGGLTSAGTPGLAYVIYTSGSTGKPKGVAVEHRNLNYLITGLEERIYRHYEAQLRTALVSPFGFDASVKQIFAALVLGHTLYIVPEEARADGRQLLSYFAEHGIEVSDGTPMHLELLMEAGIKDHDDLCLKRMLIGGDVLPRSVVESFFDCFEGDPPVISNVYGPTECTVDAAIFDVTPETVGLYDTIPIGGPLPNAQVYVLGPGDQLQPPGAGGELCIAGAGVARGYLNNPELTAEKFCRSYRTYRTGDLGRRLSDGALQFLGRGDHQVKIRGYRIELGEIEHRILSYPPLKEAVVKVWGETGDDRYLCAYFTTRDTGAVEPAAVREYLLSELPDYMLPSRFVQLDHMPLTPRGKIDRRALPEPEIGDTAGVYVAPRDDMDKELVEIWAQVLKLDTDDIGIDTDFFAIGGHSLRATNLMSRIHKAFDTWIPLQEIFKTPNVRGLAEYIKAGRKEVFTAIEPAEELAYYPLSSAQKRLYASQQVDARTTGYSLLGAMLLEGDPDPERLETIFRTLIRRHESLRTTFPVIDGEPRQKIHETVPFSLERYRAEEAEAVDFIGEQFNRPFDLSRAPLFRVGLVTVGPGRHILVINTHHIIADGTSLGILTAEFMRLSSGETLPPPVLRYVDYSQWQNSPEQRERAGRHERYWLTQLAGDWPRLDLPLDFPRPRVRNFTGGSDRFRFDAETSVRINRRLSKHDVTLNIFLLAAVNVLLFKLTGQEDIVVGCPIANRLHADLHAVVGTFPNILLLRNRPRGGGAFGAFLKDVKQHTLEAYEHQDYKLEDLMDRVAEQRDRGRNSLYDVSFHLHNVESPVMEMDGLRMSPMDLPLRASRYDLGFIAHETGGHIEVETEYAAHLFKAETIALFMKNYREVIDAVLENDDIRLADIAVTSDGVKRLRGSDAAVDEPGGDAETFYIAPRDKIETALASIWSGVLDVPSVGIDDDFFKIGGHSLKAVTVISLIHRDLEVKMPLEALFRLPTIRESAEFIRAAAKEQFRFMAPVEKRDYYPMSAAQRSMYIQYQKDKNNLGYNMSQAVRVKGRLDIERMEAALHSLIRRHESLRTSFTVVEGEPVQRVHDDVSFSMGRYDGEAGNVQELIEAFIRPFDLTRAPLIRSGVIRESETCFTWLLDMHHTVYDGTSVAIFFEEFVALYGGESEPPPLTVQYKDFACRQQGSDGRRELERQEAYWLGELSGELSRPELPLDFERPPLQTFHGASFKISLDEADTRALYELAAAENVTLFTVLYSLFSVLLSKLCRREEIIIGSVTAGRGHADLHGIIGMFVNTIVLRSFPKTGKEFISFLRETGGRVLEAFENQDYPFERLVEQLTGQRDVSRNPLFDVLFILQNTGLDEMSVRGLELEPAAPENKDSHFDLVLSVQEGRGVRGSPRRGVIHLEWEYAAALFKRETIERFARYYMEIIKQVLADPGIRLERIQMTHGLVEAGADVPKGLQDEWEL